MTVARLWWRTGGRLLLPFAIVAGVVSIAGVVYASSLTCDPGLTQAQCGRFLNVNPPSTALTAILAVLPILLGLTFGVDSVGGELEHGTGAFAWSIASSRRRWLAERVLLDVVVTATFALACGTVNAIIVSTLNPGHNLPSSFVGYGLWGPILVPRALCGYAIGLLLGMVTRRVIGSVTLGILLLSIAIPVALIIGRAFEPAQVLAVDDPSYSDGLVVEVGLAMPNGTLMTMQDCFDAAPTFPDDPNEEKRNVWQLANCPPVASYLTGPQMPNVELRESAALGLVALVCGAAAFKMIASRRP